MNNQSLGEPLDRKLHKKAVEYFETNKEELQKRPVKHVPAGFSYDLERIRESIKRKQEQINKKTEQK